MKQGSISIGIAARNEEKTIAQLLQTIVEAATLLPTTMEVEVIVGINGSTDTTEQVAADYITAYTGKPRPITFRIMHTPNGQTNSERYMYTHKQSPQDEMVFLSADTKLDKHCLKALVEAMWSNPQAHVTWAATIPIDKAKPPLRSLFYNFVDYYPQVVVRGNHFNGRAFFIRGYDVPFISPSRKQADINPRLWDFLHLATGPAIDDAYLSRATLAAYGKQSLVRVPEAITFFQPIGSLKDFYYSQRRKVYEGHRLDALFPEYSSIRRRHFKKRVEPVAFSELPSFKLKLACRVYIALYGGLWKLAAAGYGFNMLLLRVGVPLPTARIWPSLATTKQFFPDEPKAEAS